MITAKDFEKNGIIMSASFSHNMAPEIADQTIRNYLQNIHISNKNGNDLPKFNLKFAQTFIPNATNVHSDDIKKLNTALAYLQQNPEAAKLIEQAAKNGVNIVMINKGHSYFYRLNNGSPDGIIF